MDLNIYLFYRRKSLFGYTDMPAIYRAIYNYKGDLNLKIHAVQDDYLNDPKQNIFSDQSKNILVFISDIYQNDICGPYHGISAEELNNRVKNIPNILTIPSPEFMYSTGTKKYALLFKDFMLPNTFIYPNDNQQINNLPLNKYIIKYGLTSSNQGIIKLENNGQNILELMESIKTSQKDIAIKTQNILALLPENYRNSQDIINCVSSKESEDNLLVLNQKYKVESELSNFCNLDFAIIQPLSEIYQHCNEWRFMVLNDKIIGMGNQILNPGESIKNYKDSKVNLPLNPRIYKYIKDVVAKIKNEISTDYFFVRVDLIFDCENMLATQPKPELGEYFYKFIHEKVLFNPRFSNKIYLNEIEPLGSGYKKQANQVYFKDDGTQAILQYNKEYKEEPEFISKFYSKVDLGDPDQRFFDEFKQEKSYDIFDEIGKGIVERIRGVLGNNQQGGSRKKYRLTK
jgi:hypothetical protein